jgi:hypothetical protein
LIIETFEYSTNDHLTVYLPVRLYELTLKHRLLDQLGGFSHLLIDALFTFSDQGEDWVRNLTSLSPQQLQPITKRLQGLGLLQDGGLTDKGQTLALFKQRLHGQTRRIWLDGNYRELAYFASDSLQVTRLADQQAFVLRPWNKDPEKSQPWSSYDRNEDCQRQKNRLLKNPELYLPAMFETFNSCFVEIDHCFNPCEWELEVRFFGEAQDQFGVAVEINASEMRTGIIGDFAFSSPLLALHTRYRVPELAPSWLKDQLPEDQLRIMAFVEPEVDPDQLNTKPHSKWIWPELGFEVRHEAVSWLFKELSENLDSAVAIFNCEHRVEELWQSISFNWAAVCRRLEDAGMHTIRR